MYRALLTKIRDRVVESAERDQTTHKCRLILLYTLRNKRSLAAIGKIKVYIDLSIFFFNPAADRKFHLEEYANLNEC